MKVLLVIDVGNTNIVFGIYERDHLIKSWRIWTRRDQTPDEFAIVLANLFLQESLDMKSIKDVIVSCVVPPLIEVITGFARKYLNLEPLFVGPGIKTGMPILYDNPRDVGADRVVNAVAAYEKYKRSCIIVDFGTATTFDYVSERGEYIGGAIAPGILISTEALFQRASKLPRIELVKPKTIIGRNTPHSMQAGIIYGYVGLVDGIVKKMKEEAGGDPMVVATGGLAKIIASESETIKDVDENLTLEGLKIIYYRNRG